MTLDKDAPVSRPVQRTGVVRSLGILADFITTTSEFGFSTRTGLEEHRYLNMDLLKEYKKQAIRQAA